MEELLPDWEIIIEDESSEEEGGQTSSPPGRLVPLVHVQYYDSDHAQGIYQLIEAYMLSLQADSSSSSLRQCVDATRREARDEGSVMMDSAQDSKDESESEVKGQVEYYVGYCLDRFPMTYKTEVVFEQVYQEPFWADKCVRREAQRLRRMAIKCFNCGEDHHMNQCTEPLNFQRVIEESRIFKDTISPLGADKRYHMAQTTDRFSKFKPGVISARLRQALGMEPDDTPPYVTRMCILGYPPGYRLQARESELLLYNEPDQALKSTVKDIVYPGFNDVVKPQKNPPPEDEDTHDMVQEEEKAAKQPRKRQTRKRNVVKAAQKNHSILDNPKDDLGTLSDYELEEMDGADGEIVVGFCVKNNLHSELLSVGPIPEEKKSFSLDFPPGLVDLENQQQPTEQWNSIKNIIGHG